MSEYVQLADLTVAGLSKGDMSKRLGELEDMPVQLVREKANQFDPNAIKVMYETSGGSDRQMVKLGYVPAVFCPILLNLRAAGYDVKASITTNHLPHSVGLHFTIEKKS